MFRGYLKLHRKILESVVFSNPELLKIWVWCLCRANIKEKFVSINTGRGYTEVKLKSGQFITGQFSASEELSLKPSKVYSLLKKLERIGKIERKAYTKYSLITINNFVDYQQLTTSDEKRTENELKTNLKRTKTEYKEDNEKNDKKLLFKNCPYSDLQVFIKSFEGSKYEAADLEYYFEAVLNWSNAKNVKRIDWLATARNFMLRDHKVNKLKLKNGTKQITENEQAYIEWLKD